MRLHEASVSQRRNRSRSQPQSSTSRLEDLLVHQGVEGCRPRRRGQPGRGGARPPRGAPPAALVGPPSLPALASSSCADLGIGGGLRHHLEDRGGASRGCRRRQRPAPRVASAVGSARRARPPRALDDRHGSRSPRDAGVEDGGEHVGASCRTRSTRSARRRRRPPRPPRSSSRRSPARGTARSAAPTIRSGSRRIGVADRPLDPGTNIQ